MKYAESISVLLATLAFVAFVGWLSLVAAEPNLSSEDIVATSSLPASRLVNLYYYNPQNDITEAGALACSAAGLVAAPRLLRTGNNLPERALKQLFAGAITSQERAAGITSEFPLADFQLIGLGLRPDGTAVVAVDDPASQTGGSACRATVLRAQVTATLEQFPTVSAVEIIPETAFRP